MLIVATFLSAIMMKSILGYKDDFTWEAALLYGSIISATDPVAVVSLLKELGASKQLSTLIEGESLLNDGTAMVVFFVMLDIVEGKQSTPGQVAMKFIRLSGGGPLFGIFVGFIVSILLSKIFNNFALEVNTTIVACYIMFYFAEFTNLGFSGILALVALGLFMTYSGKTKISTESQHALHHIWGYVGFVAETLIFMLSGIIIGDRFIGTAHFDPDNNQHDKDHIGWKDVYCVFFAYVILHFIRFFCIMLFWPFLRKMGYGMTFTQVVLCAYSGLRGAVGMSLALMVAGSHLVPVYVRNVILMHVSGVALLTLLINATTTGRLVKFLKLNHYSDFKKNVLFSISMQIDQNIDNNIRALKIQRYMKYVNWNILRSNIRMHGTQKEYAKYKDINLVKENETINYRTQIRNLPEDLT